MFGFMKKHTADREEKEKKKREKKDKKEKKKSIEKGLTPEELGRLEEAKIGLFYKGSDAERYEQVGGAMPYPHDVTPSDSNDSLNSQGHDPGGTNYTSAAKVEISKTVRVPPPTHPKPKKGILKGKSNYGPEIPNQGVSSNVDDTMTLEENTLINEIVPGEMAKPDGKPEQKAKVVKSMIKTRPMDAPPMRPMAVKSGSLTKQRSPSQKAAPPSAAGDIVVDVGEDEEVAGELSAEPLSPTTPVTTEKTFSNVDLQLPSLAPPRCPKPREIILKRQPAGDFGFSLRRGTVLERGRDDSSGSEKKRQVIFAEPGPKNTQTGLLPGDRLVEVNGQNVEVCSREEIIELIKRAKSSVQLVVQPIPELSELSLRSGLDGEDVTIEEQSMKTGTLQRSGSMRFKSRSAKTEAEVASERAYLSGEQVWLVHKGGFASAKKVTGGEEGEGRSKVKLDHGAEELEVDEDDVERANPPQYDRVEDLASLRYLNESSLLHTLRQRYGSNLVHSYGGQSLLVLNPMHPLSIYSEKVIQMFRGCKPEDMPPHVYAVAQTAYRTMLSSRQHQSLVFLGRSGSGKTTCTRHILHFFTVAAGSVGNTLTVEKLNAIFTLLDAFGNSRTIMNTSATRFTHIFSLDFDHNGQIASASIQVLMLDKMRVVKRPEGEPTFHVFYQMLAGIDTHLRKELQLENLNEPNLFMTPLQRSEDRQRATQAWAKIHHALSTLNIKEEEMKALYLVLAAIYHLGIAGTMKGPNNKYQFARPAAAQRAASVLGTTVEELSRTIFSSSQAGTPKRTGSFAGPGQADKSTEMLTGLECLEGFVVGLYAEVFNALVSLMNRCLSSGHRTVSSLLILDNPGVQNPSTCGRQAGARFEDLCHNYMQERLQLLFHELVFTSQQDLYAQENIECDFEPVSSSPAPMVALLDQNVQQTLVRQAGGERNNMELKGLFWLLDEEAIYPGATEDTFLQRLFAQYAQHPKQGKAILLKRGKAQHSFVLNHYQGTNPVTYTVKGWLRTSRENPVAWSVNTFLQESSRRELSGLFSTMRSSLGGLSLAPGDTSSLRRVSSLRRGTAGGAAAIKRKSVCLQVKFQVDSIIETLRKTRVYFVHCLLPQHNGGLCDLRMALGQTKPNTYEDFAMNVPLVRSQIRGNEVLEAIRIHRQGFPEHMLFEEFRRRFDVLVPQDVKPTTPLGDDKLAVQKILEQLDVDKATYRLGLSQVFFRTGGLSKLEEAREEKITGFIVQLQSKCRGYLGRQRLQKLKVQHLAVRCIQRNVRKYLAVRDWSWWRLYNKIQPLLNVHRTEEELKNREVELEQLKMKLAKLEKERNELKLEVDTLSARLAETSADLSEVHTTSSTATELLESEQADRMRMDKELREIQSKFHNQQRKLEMTEMDLMQARMFSTQYDSEADDEVDGEDSVYRERYDKLKRELHFTKQKMTQQHEEEMEQCENSKKTHDRKLLEALEDAEDQRRQVQNLKRKLQRLNQEMSDIKLHLEEQYSRNTELEKKQRKFDSELHKVNEEMRQEKVQREKLQRERDQLAADKYTIEQELKNLHIDYELSQEKVQRLNRELTELSADNKDDKEVMHLKRLRNELEQKLQDQEEELDDQAGTIQQLEQAKLRLEMAQEKLRQQHAKELEEKEAETEEMRATTQKKMRTLESQIEEEYSEKQAAVKEKRELERRLQSLSEQTPTRDRDAERRLRRDLKKTKALLHDAHMMLEKQKDAGSKVAIKQLRNQLEDAEYATAAAVKARKGIEVEVQELQQQLEIVTKNKQEVETRLMGIVRENTDHQTRCEEHDEELDEIMRKYKAAVQQLSVDKKQIQAQSQEVEDALGQKQQLQEQVVSLQSTVDYMRETMVDKQSLVRLEAKVKDLETRLELEQTGRQRAEGQLGRIKDQQDRIEEEKDRCIASEKRQQEEVRQSQRSLRDTREELGNVQGKEAEASQRKHDLEQRLQSLESDYEQSQSDLRLAFKRISDLQTVIEDQVDSDMLDDDDDDSDLVDSDGSSLDSDTDSDLDESLVNHHQPRVIHLSGDSNETDSRRVSEAGSSTSA